MSVHPPTKTIRIKDTKHPGIFMEATPFISSKDETLVPANTRQQNFTNLILQTIGNQLSRVEEKIFEVIPEKSTTKENPSSSLNPFSLKVFKKETNNKEKEIQKIDLKPQLQVPGFKLSKNDPQFLSNLLEILKDIKDLKLNVLNKKSFKTISEKSLDSDENI